MQSSQTDKSEESKLMENGSTVAITVSNTSAISSSNVAAKSGVPGSQPGPDISKELPTKDDSLPAKE